MRFITTVLDKKGIARISHPSPKLVKIFKKEGRVRIFVCKKTGKVYLNNWRVFEMKACEDFDDADKQVILTF